MTGELKFNNPQVFYPETIMALDEIGTAKRRLERNYY